MGQQDIGEHPMRFLKLKEVMEKTALSRSAIYRKMNDGEFPQSVSLGERAIAGWKAKWMSGWTFVLNSDDGVIIHASCTIAESVRCLICQFEYWFETVTRNKLIASFDVLSALTR